MTLTATMVCRRDVEIVGQIRLLGIAALVVVAFVLMGCDSVDQYSGDGKLVDNGPSAATERYVLDLGPVALKSETSFKFRLENLPKRNFVVGIELRAAETLATALDKGSINPAVSISLVSSDGKTVIAKEGRLSEWIWADQSPGNYAFVYGREPPSTYFTPEPRSRYELTLRVLEPDRGAANYRASLVAKSGGWK